MDVVTVNIELPKYRVVCVTTLDGSSAGSLLCGRTREYAKGGNDVGEEALWCLNVFKKSKGHDADGSLCSGQAAPLGRGDEPLGESWVQSVR
jgi:hypothetical protein